MTTSPLPPLKKRLLVLDFDGTLADTHRSIVRTTLKTYEILRLPAPEEEDIRRCIGLSLTDTFLTLGIGAKEAAEEAAQVYRDHFDAIAAGNVALYEGVAETLASLHARGVTLTIASSRNSRSLEALTTETGIRKYFTLMLGADNVAHPKPAPDAVLDILRRTGHTAGETLMVGDATYDILMGNAAGCETIAVTYGNQSAEELLTAHPTHLAHSFAEMEEWI